jgi:hypothetical protein
VSRLFALIGISCSLSSCASEEFKTETADGGAVKRVFMTSLDYAADFGGPASADALCMQHASSLGGAWTAWLGVESTPASDRLSAWSGEYRVVRAGKVADSWGDLTDGQLDAAIDRDENGDAVPALARAWTGTRPDGTWSGKDCSSWGSSLDALVATAGGVAIDGSWTEGDDVICNLPARLYCIEQ